MKLPLRSIAGLVIVPLIMTLIIVDYVWERHYQTNSSLIDQFNPISAPENDAILTDDSILKSYIKKYGPAPTMHTIIAAANRTQIDCHNRAHEFGRMSYEVFGNTILQLNLPECHSGFYHGAIEAYFKKYGTDNLAEKLSFICPDNLNGFFMHQCRHGIGHGLMSWSSYDLPAALDYCSMITDEWGQGSCRGGVFMENIVGSLRDSPEAQEIGHYTEYLSEDPQFPCNAVKDEYKNDCYFLQTDRMLALSKTAFQGVVDSCTAAPEQYHRNCFASMGRTVGGSLRGQPAEAISACRLIPDQTNRIECIMGVSKDYLWDSSGQEGGLRFCSMVSVEDGMIECYKALTDHARAVLNTEQLSSFCARIPQELYAICQGSPS